MSSLIVGLASGLGNCVYMLPTIKALRLLGHEITLSVQTDFPMENLWRRCVYASYMMDASLPANGIPLFAGQYRPPAWARREVKQYRIPAIHACEWRSNLRLARDLGWSDENTMDVSDWCRGLDRSPRWDIGIVPGSKGGIWLRKRWPGLAQVSAHFIQEGRRVAVFGLEDDGIASIPGETVDTPEIWDLPDALAGCKIVIGCDSGVTHLASSLGIPVVMVYTATSAIKAEPVWSPHWRIASEESCAPCVSTPRWMGCGEWKCHGIDPTRVIDAAEKLLEDK
jgi:hypothetical protein